MKTVFTLEGAIGMDDFTGNAAPNESAILIDFPTVRISEAAIGCGNELAVVRQYVLLFDGLERDRISRVNRINPMLFFISQDWIHGRLPDCCKPRTPA